MFATYFVKLLSIELASKDIRLTNTVTFSILALSKRGLCAVLRQLNIVLSLGLVLPIRQISCLGFYSRLVSVVHFTSPI